MPEPPMMPSTDLVIALAHPFHVMAGLVPAIHVFYSGSKSWMPATSAGMTTINEGPRFGALCQSLRRYPSHDHIDVARGSCPCASSRGFSTSRQTFFLVK